MIFILWILWIFSDIPRQYLLPLGLTLIWILWRTSGRRD